jgi:hypothetical protein
MRNFFLLFLVFITSCTLALGQRTISDPNAQKREVSGYHALSVSNGIEVILTQGTTEAVAVSATVSADRDKITTVVEKGVLKISYDYNLWKLWKGVGNKKLKAYVSVVNIDAINISAGSGINVDGALKSPALTMHVSSGARFDGRVEMQTMNIEQSSGSRARVSGSVKELTCSASSGSKFSGYGLVVSNCNAKTTSGAKMEITVNVELSADVASGGNIYYRGPGVIRNIRSASGGKVSRGQF